MKKSTTHVLIVRILSSYQKPQNDVKDYWSKQQQKDYFRELSSDDMNNIEEITEKTSKSLEFETKSAINECWTTEVISIDDYDSNDFDEIESAEERIEYVKTLA